MVVLVSAACRAPCEASSAADVRLGEHIGAATTALDELHDRLALPLCVEEVVTAPSLREPARYRRVGRRLELAPHQTEAELLDGLYHGVFHALQHDHRVVSGEDREWLDDRLLRLGSHHGMRPLGEAVAHVFEGGPVALAPFGASDCDTASPAAEVRRWLAGEVLLDDPAELEIRQVGRLPWKGVLSLSGGAADDGHRIALRSTDVELGIGRRLWLDPATGEVTEALDDAPWAHPLTGECVLPPDHWNQDPFGQRIVASCWTPDSPSVALATSGHGLTTRLLATDGDGHWRPTGTCPAEISQLVWLLDGIWLVEWNDDGWLTWSELRP